MSSSKSLVVMKGVKEGLLFRLDDKAPADEVIQELYEKLNHTHSQFLYGPLAHVVVRVGHRPLTDSLREAILDAFSARGNLVVKSISGEPDAKAWAPQSSLDLKTMTHIVRSGQTLHVDEDVLLIGDVNPGGTITSNGSIIILGSLRGIAHAGQSGNAQAIIIASHLRPTQLRIAGVISRPPDEWGFEEAFMEFAYLHDGFMEIDKIHQLHRIRPQFGNNQGA
jgi:septum site-determining protein MinC